MKKTLVFLLILFPLAGFSQSILGTWQQTDSKTCFQTNMKETEAEKELESQMRGTSATSVAKLITFKKDGSGKESIFSAGRKKRSELSDFKYKLNGQELSFIDKKSGIITSRFIVDELTDSSLKIHDAVKDCEIRIFTRAK
jgi:uncharacterized protein YxeA